MELSQQMQKKLADYQTLQQQLQLIAGQKQQLDFQTKEIERTLEELEKIDDKNVIYKSIGSLLVKADNKEKIVNELKEQKEVFEVKAKTLEKQIERMKSKLQELQQEISLGVGKVS